MLTSWKRAVPAERGRETTGRVAQLSHGRFCGVIHAGSGQRVFFHGRDLESVKYNDVIVGTAVAFELIADPVSGPRAVRVRVIRGTGRRAG